MGQFLLSMKEVDTQIIRPWVLGLYLIDFSLLGRPLGCVVDVILRWQCGIRSSKQVNI